MGHASLFAEHVKTAAIPMPRKPSLLCPSGWSGHVTWLGFEWKWFVQLSAWQKAAAQTPPSALLPGHGPGRAAPSHPAFHSHLESQRLSRLSNCILGSLCYNHLLCILTNEFNCDFTQVSAISLLSAQNWFTLTSSYLYIIHHYTGSLHILPQGLRTVTLLS